MRRHPLQITLDTYFHRPHEVYQQAIAAILAKTGIAACDVDPNHPWFRFSDGTFLYAEIDGEGEDAYINWNAYPSSYDLVRMGVLDEAGAAAWRAEDAAADKERRRREWERLNQEFGGTPP